MRPMQRVPGLKRDHIVEANLFETLARLCRSESQLSEVVTRRQLQNLEWPRSESIAPPMHFSHERMPQVDGAEHESRCCLQIPFIDFFDAHCRNDFIARIA